jgi:hypothetical protein
MGGVVGVGLAVVRLLVVMGYQTTHLSSKHSILLDTAVITLYPAWSRFVLCRSNKYFYILNHFVEDFKNAVLSFFSWDKQIRIHNCV